MGTVVRNVLLVVEHWMGKRAQAILLNQTPNTSVSYRTRKPHRAKLMRRKGNNPWLSVKASKLQLSLKGSFLSQTARRLAQKQPPFKDSVTAHWSMRGSAEDLSRISCMPKLEILSWIYSRWSGRGAFQQRWSWTGRFGGAVGSENVGLSSAQLRWESWASNVQGFHCKIRSQWVNRFLRRGQMA